MKHYKKLKKAFLVCLSLGLTVAWGQTETFNYTGSTQNYVVPADVNKIQITTVGAAGGQGINASSGIPGFGASIQGTFDVTPGETLIILVGGKGVDGANYVGGGGGGSFVWIDATDELLSAAGGGGGGGSTDDSDTFVDGIDASVGMDGSDGAGYSDGGGTGGNGGVAPSSLTYASGGAGWNSNGAFGTDHECAFESEGGNTPLSGGAGGSGGGSAETSSFGGFGGGGGANARCGAVGGGGGGGYSGGGAGGEIIDGDFNGGGGGGSFNGGSNQVNSAGAGTTNGEVVISVVCHVIELTATMVDEISGSDGAINLSVSGGESPYTFDWDNDGTGDFDDSEDLVALTAGTYTVVVKDNTGCLNDDSFTVNSQVGIDEVNGENIAVYPNPTTEMVTIQFNGAFNYELTTVNGEIITNGSAVNSQEISLIDQAKGVYLVKIIADGSVRTIKVVKE